MNTPGWNWTAIGVSLALFTATASLIYNYAVSQARDDRQDNDIRQLQDDNRALVPTMRRMELSIAKIETKLEVILPTASKQDAHQ